MSALLNRALASGRVVVNHTRSGETMVRVSRPDPRRPGRQAHEPIVVPPNARYFELTSRATVEELRRSDNLTALCDPPAKILDIVFPAPPAEECR